jgi:ketosteroid isomerase-like protein
VASSNLDLVRSIYVARERDGRFSSGWADPEIEFTLADGPNPGSWIGVGPMVDAWRDFLAAWDEVLPEVEAYRELDAERVLVLVRYKGRGKTSGMELTQMQARIAALFHLRDGLVTKLVVYFDRERALADLGLAPQTDAMG